MRSFRYINLRLLTLLFVTACLSAAGFPPAQAAIQLVPVLQGLSSPLYVTNAHDNSNRLFILEQPGTIKVLAPGASATTTLVDISSKVLFNDEQGLLGLAFHPQFATNSRFFVNYTRKPDGATVIAEYHASADPIATAASEIVLLTIAQPFANHNGGMIEFGQDGFLYIGSGDGGSSNDPGNRAQNIDDLLGKILRIDVDHPAGGLPYSSPVGNPYLGATPGRDEIYAVGMRNPFRFSFDRQTGQLYVGDVGQNAWEEIDIVTAGGNYGWRVYEGAHCTNLDPGLCTPANYVAPIAEYGHGGGRCSVTGGYVYRGSTEALPTGTYVFGDYCSGEIFSLTGGTLGVLLDTSLNISSFGEDEAGEMYVVGLGGTIHRIASLAANSTTTTLASSGTPAVAGAVVTFTATVVGAAPTGTVTFTDGGTTISGCGAVALSGSGNSRTAVCSSSTLAVGVHSIVAAYNGGAGNLASTSAPLSQVITGGAGGSSNVALASAGGVATASSRFGAAYPEASVINNERAGVNWNNGGGWADATPNSYPDWVRIDFNGSKSINRVVVYSVQDNDANPVEPSDNLTFTKYGLTDFTVEGWNGSAWVPLATVSGNTLVKRTVTFAAFTTDRIRINVTHALFQYTCIIEIEAWGTDAGGVPPTTTTLASSGTPAVAGSMVTFTATVTGTNPTGSVNFTDGGTSISGCSAAALSGSGNTRTAACATSSLAVGNHSIVANYSGDPSNAASSSTPLVQGITDPSASSNVALASAGGVATASSRFGAAYPEASVINNERAGVNWNNGGGWADATPNSYPDWVRIDFNGSKSINRVVVYSVQDNDANPVEPSDNLTFTKYGLTDFTVEGWNGSAWVPLATVSGNTLVKRTVTFAAFTTDRIRINVTHALFQYTCIIEIEAWGTDAGGVPPTTTTLASSGTPAVAGSMVTFTATVTGTNPTGSVNFTDGGTSISGCSAAALSGSGNSRTATCATSSLSVGTHSIVANYSGDPSNAASSSAPLSQVITGGAGGSSNVALASAGGVATASSRFGAAYPEASVINNERAGVNWNNGGGWADATPNSYPDWVRIDFNGSKSINRVVVYSVQDAVDTAPVEPSDNLTFTKYGLTDFTVEGWNGSAWVPLATVSGNTLVKRTVTFAAFTTDRIRINVTHALFQYTCIIEIEAWGTDAAGPPAAGAPWTTFGRDAQHTALSTTASQRLNQIHWQMPVDLQPQYSGNGSLLVHYGSPVITAANTVIVPVKTGATNGFRVEARAGSNGALKWSMTTDYILPAHNWVPAFGPALTSQSRLYFPGAGGTLYFRDDADATSGTSGQIAFYGIANYQANPQAYNAAVTINTPLTTDSSGNIYFGFLVTGSTPAGLTSGIARISASGQGTWTPVTTASSDPNMTRVPHNSAPALSADSQTLYVAVSNSNSGYLVALNSTTLAPMARVLLTDPKSGLNGILSDNGSASPTVGTDGDVYFGVLDNPFGSNHRRGWLLHFNATLSQVKTPGAFGWDTTVGLVPAQMVPSYQGTSTYLLGTKYNHYLGQGGDGMNKVAILDPNATQVDPVSGATVMKEVLTILGPTPESGGGVKEWCINTAAVDPLTKSILANNEDGKLYRWDLTTNTLSQTVVLTAGLGEAYTSTVIGPDGKVYATNNATLFAVGQ